MQPDRGTLHAVQHQQHKALHPAGQADPVPLHGPAPSGRSCAMSGLCTSHAACPGICGTQTAHAAAPPSPAVISLSECSAYVYLPTCRHPAERACITSDAAPACKQGAVFVGCCLALKAGGWMGCVHGVLCGKLKTLLPTCFLARCCSPVGAELARSISRFPSSSFTLPNCRAAIFCLPSTGDARTSSIECSKGSGTAHACMQPCVPVMRERSSRAHSVPHLNGRKVQDCILGCNELGQVLDGAQQIACSGTALVYFCPDRQALQTAWVNATANSSFGACRALHKLGSSGTTGAFAENPSRTRRPAAVDQWHEAVDDEDVHRMQVALRLRQQCFECRQCCSMALLPPNICCYAKAQRQWRMQRNAGVNCPP